MRKLCERPGCAAPAEVSYGIDNAALLVWVDNRPIPERELAGRLCRRHADAISVPRGWTVDDRRLAVPQLFRPADMPSVEPVKKAQRIVKAAKAAEQDDKKLTLFETIAEEMEELEKSQSTSDSVSEPAQENISVDPDETRAIPWSPRLSSSVRDEDDEDQPVMGRLLGRAFGQRRNDDQ